jgi:hypothetical protein
MLNNRHDRNLILHLPSGYRHIFLLASYFKRLLATRTMTVGDRLEILEALASMAGEGPGTIKPEALAIVKPANDISAQIIEEARKLDTDDDPLGQRSFDVLTSQETFETLVRANPSIMEAIRLGPRPPISADLS